jgi:hypothetical protein
VLAWNRADEKDRARDEPVPRGGIEEVDFSGASLWSMRGTFAGLGCLLGAIVCGIGWWLST